MPLYAYRCRSCGHEFEALVRSNDAPGCPACGGGALDQQLSLIAKPAPGGETASAPPCQGGSGMGCGACCPAMGECG